MSFEGPSLKRVKVLQDITLEEVNKFFGPIVNRNGCSYVHTEDPNFIKKVKTLWMVVHQKPYLLASRLISLGMAQGLASKKIHGKPMNWALYVEWTNKKQQWHKVQVEQIELLSDEEENEYVIPHIETEERNPIVNVVGIFSDLIIICQMLKFLHFKYVRFWGFQNFEGCIRLVTLSILLFLFFSGM